MNNTIKSTIFKGQNHKDARGTLTFFNTFNFSKVKRMYVVENTKSEPIRAFHGHKKEEKYVYVILGKILLCTVKVDNVKKPSVKTKVIKKILSSDTPQIVHIPAGYANGFKSLTKDACVIFFSSFTLKQSQKDDYRYPADYWGKEVWITHG